MAKGQEPTTKFRVDISELKQNMQAAQREIRLANAEFKAATAGMDNWADSADGLSKKLKQLEKTESAQQKQLDLLREQHRLVVAEQGEHSKAAEELEIKIKNQEAAIGKTSKSIDDYKAKLNEATNGTEELADAVEKAADSAEDAEGGFTVLKGALASLVADGIRAAADAFTELLTAGDQAMGTFQAKTGASADEMARFSDEINTLYKNNFGEDLGDVADAMATVAQNTKEVDPSKIRELTENALTLRDTFGWEVNETMRAANMLMDQFGITGDEAFALISQGAQNGLDKNGDLLDSVNEYSVHYKQLGLTAEDFFNSLQNGTNAGTFSVDKLGDAMKEFGIRVKDGSEGTITVFEGLGFKSLELTDAFNKGGAAAKEATQAVLQKLMEMPEGLDKNVAGVTLFGSMWEDLGAEGIAALSNINGAADQTAQTMDQIKEAKYADVGNQLSEIGRIIKMDFIAPLANKLLPLIKDGLTWISENLNTLIPIVVGLGTALVTTFAVGKITTFVGAMTKGITAFKTATTVSGGLKAAMAALNLTMSLNPIGVVTALITGLVAAFVVLWNKSDAFRNFWIDMWNNIKTTFTSVVTSIKNSFAGLKSSLFDAGANALRGFWDGLKSVASAIKEWATNFFGSILAKAEEVLDIHSPSRAMRRIAEYTMEGFDEGLTSGSKSVMANVRDTFTNVRNGASQALGGLSGGSGALGANSSVGDSKAGANVIYNFNQTNNSPKSLSRREIYRQSKNLLNRGRVYV